MIGLTVSHYRIIEKLGVGGMGVVFVAEDTQLARRVAIKFLSTLDRPYRARFLREARAVSKLQHQNIATVFEYGETPEGQPYIVMELVKGKTLHELLDEVSLSLLQSVHVAESIAEALAEAHRLGIVHRDIKPSNVVVNEREQVKVLDFGLAKLLDDQVDAEDGGNVATLLATRTQSNVVVGTPLYLSPEQATGRPVDGRSDLFALGALLYECLTGQSAFSGSSAIEIGAQIIHVNPPPPSSINPAVTKELDRITMKALEKSVTKRYQTAAEILHDLKQVAGTLTREAPRRVVRGSRDIAPTREVRQSALTTIAETIRRPRLSLATFAIGILVVALAVWAVVRWWKPTPYKPSAVAQEWFNKGTDALREGAFWQAGKSLDKAVQEDPNFALAHAYLAEAWWELDYSDRAKNELMRVTALVPNRQLLPRDQELYLEAINATVSRDFPAAINAYKNLVAIKSNDARSYVDLGRAYERNEELDKAIENYVKAASIDSEYATAYLRAGGCYSRKSDFASASAAFDKAQTLFKAFANAEGLTEVFRQRGILLRSSGRFDEANQQFELAFETASATGNEFQQISSLLDRSFLAFNRGFTDQAQSYAEKAVDFARKRQLENLAVSGLIELGNAHKARGEFDDAEKYYKQAIDFAHANNGQRRKASAMLNLGGMYIQQLRTDEGLALVEEAYAFFQANNYRRQVMICLSEMARGNRRKGNYEAALKALEQKLEIAQQTGNQPEIAFAYGDIGSVEIEQQRYPEALANYDRSYALNKELGRAIMIAYNQHNRANILWRLGEADKAREALTESFEIASRPDSTYKALLPDIRLSHAQIYLSERKFQDAIRTSEEAIKLAGTSYPNVSIEARYTLGLAKSLSGATREGLKLCEAASNEATNSKDEGLISRSLLAHAEAAVESGEVELGLRLATQAAERFAKNGQQESEWRAWLIAGMASAKGGDRTNSETQFAKGRDVLRQLENKWNPEAIKLYLRRADIQFYSNKLG